MPGLLDECCLCIRRSACRLYRYLTCAHSGAFSESSFFIISRVLCASDRLLSSGKEWAVLQKEDHPLWSIPQKNILNVLVATTSPTAYMLMIHFPILMCFTRNNTATCIPNLCCAILSVLRLRLTGHYALSSVPAHCGASACLFAFGSCRSSQGVQQHEG